MVDGLEKCGYRRLEDKEIREEKLLRNLIPRLFFVFTP